MLPSRVDASPLPRVGSRAMVWLIVLVVIQFVERVVLPSLY